VVVVEGRGVIVQYVAPQHSTTDYRGLLQYHNTTYIRWYGSTVCPDSELDRLDFSQINLTSPG
jgi:hypothetical protein